MKRDKLIKLLNPIFHYLMIQEKLEIGDYRNYEYETLDKLLYKKGIKARKNIKKIHKIFGLKTIIKFPLV